MVRAKTDSDRTAADSCLLAPTTEVADPLRPLSTGSRWDFDGVIWAWGDLSGVLVTLGDLAGVACPGDFIGVPWAPGDFPGVVCVADFTGVTWALLRADVTCLTLKGVLSAMPVLMARMRTGVFETDLWILWAEVEEVRGGENTEGPVETEFE